MKYEKILPTVLIIIDAVSALPYMVKHEYGTAVYWIAAAVLNVAVTYLM